MTRTKRILIVLAGVVCASGVGRPSAAAAGAPVPATRPAPLPPLADRGRATLDLIERRLRGPRSARPYLQEIKPADPTFRPAGAFNWAMGIQLSALNAAARVDPPRYRQAVDDCVRLLDGYWIEAAGVGGYADAPRPRGGDRYYDDNAWVVLGLLEAYEQTREAAYLDRAKRAAAFVFSGEDDRLGGGLYWKEREKATKNTCSNAPATVGALRLYQLTGDARYRAVADRLYAWTTRTLQDPADGLFFDKVGLDGRIDRKKWSYNSALMIRANCLFFDVTNDRRYLTEAQRIARSAVARWFRDDGRVADPSYFAHLLCEALLELGQRDGDAHWRELVARTADFVWRSNRDPDGAHPERWDAQPDGPLQKVELMPQASAARLFFRLAAVGPSPSR